MRKKTIVLGVIELILLVYGCIAYRSIKGLHIYLLSYELGKIFVYTYIPVIFLAIIGMVFVIRLVKNDIKTLKIKKAQNKEIKAKKKKQKIADDKLEEATVLLQTEESEEATVLLQAEEQEEATVIKLFCNQCGNEIKPNQKFCIKCGNKLTWE